MDVLKKWMYLLPVLAAAGMITIRLTGIGSFDGIYRAIRVAALIYVAALCFKKAARLNDKDALFTGALGLGVLTVSEIYNLVLTIISGEAVGILHISDYSDAGSYLFFLAAIMLLLLPPIKWERYLRLGVGVVFCGIIAVTIYSVAANNERLLYINVIGTAIVCIGLSAWLLYQSRKVTMIRSAACYASSMLFLGVLDIGLYLMKYFDNTYLHSLFSPLYLLSFLFIGDGLLRLRSEE